MEIASSIIVRFRTIKQDWADCLLQTSSESNHSGSGMWLRELETCLAECSAGGATHLPAGWLLSSLSISDGFDGTYGYCSIAIKGAWQTSSTWIHVIDKVRCVFSGGRHNAVPKSPRPDAYGMLDPVPTEDLQFLARLGHVFGNWKSREQ